MAGRPGESLGCDEDERAWMVALKLSLEELEDGGSRRFGLVFIVVDSACWEPAL